jgi:PIN domain nuclease of toxin-antitoxin system
VRVLLDTPALLWWLGGDKKLPARARKAIADEGNDILVSAASAWEVATKVRLGRLPDAEFIAVEFGRHLANQGFLALDITVEHGRLAGSLPGPHRDPFDRMLIAQARAESLILVSNEVAFDRYGVDRLW